MRYLSLFSGIEAASVAWHPLGWRPVAFAEIEPFPCAVLAHHYPDVPNLGDVTQITDEQIKALGSVDVVVGGSPCQNLSIAGNRKGLSGAQSGLFHEQIRIFHAARKHCGARWLVWENVPGAFSSNQGADFAVMVGALAGCEISVPAKGWKREGVALGERGLVEWAVLDAQWFGLAQRRKRVFAVLDTGTWQDRPPILLERDSLRGDTAPCRAAQTYTAAGVGANAENTGTTTDTIVYQCHGGSVGPIGTLRATGSVQSGVPFTLEPVAKCLNAGGMGRRDYESETFVYACKRSNTQSVGLGISSDGSAYTLDTSQVQAIAVHGSQDPDISVDCAHTLGRNQGQENAVFVKSYVRRLTSRECERLQGFPDDYTQIAWRGKPAESCPDSPRYKALGNSMAVPVMRWIGQQIDAATSANINESSLTEQAA